MSKTDGILYAFSGDDLLLAAPAATGLDRSGPKRKRGDMRTPEGSYPLDYKKQTSSYHKSIHVGYPTPSQSAAALAAGVDPGDEILVHGPKLTPDGLEDPLPATEGCVALSEEDMDALWDLVEPGTPIIILP